MTYLDHQYQEIVGQVPFIANFITELPADAPNPTPESTDPRLVGTYRTSFVDEDDNPITADINTLNGIDVLAVPGATDIQISGITGNDFGGSYILTSDIYGITKSYSSFSSIPANETIVEYKAPETAFFCVKYEIDITYKQDTIPGFLGVMYVYLVFRWNYEAGTTAFLTALGLL